MTLSDFADEINRLIYSDDAPTINIGLITLIPEAEREAFLASLHSDEDDDE